MVLIHIQQRSPMLPATIAPFFEHKKPEILKILNSTKKQARILLVPLLGIDDCTLIHLHTIHVQITIHDSPQNQDPSSLTKLAVGRIRDKVGQKLLFQPVNCNYMLSFLPCFDAVAADRPPWCVHSSVAAYVYHQYHSETPSNTRGRVL